MCLAVCTSHFVWSWDPHKADRRTKHKPLVTYMWAFGDYKNNSKKTFVQLKRRGVPGGGFCAAGHLQACWHNAVSQKHDRFCSHCNRKRGKINNLHNFDKGSLSLLACPKTQTTSTETNTSWLGALCCLRQSGPMNRPHWAPARVLCVLLPLTTRACMPRPSKAAHSQLYPGPHPTGHVRE